RPQRTGRNDPAVADAAPGVDHEHRKILDERGIVEAVVHDDDARAGGDGGALDAVARHNGRRRAREQQRLVAHVPRTMPRPIGPDGAGAARGGGPAGPPRWPGRRKPGSPPPPASRRATASAVGVLPAPPTVKLPMQTTAAPARRPRAWKRARATAP